MPTDGDLLTHALPGWASVNAQGRLWPSELVMLTLSLLFSSKIRMSLGRLTEAVGLREN